GGTAAAEGIRRQRPADTPKNAEPAVAPKPSEQLPDFDTRVDLVDHRDVDGGVASEHGAFRRIAAQAVENRQRVRRDERAYPLDDVAVVVVMRRLDQNELAASLWLRKCTHHPNNSRSPPTSRRCIHQSNQL